MSDRRVIVTPMCVIVRTEQEMPGAWEVRCTGCHRKSEPHERCNAMCHDVTWTPWGEDHASAIGELHIYYMTHPLAPRLHHLAHKGQPTIGGRRV